MRRLAAVIVLAIVVRALFFRVGLGLDWLAFQIVATAAIFFGLGARTPRAPAVVAASAGLLSSAAFVVRAGALSAAIAIPTSFGLLLLLALLRARDVSFADLGELPSRLVSVFCTAPKAVSATVRLPKEAIVELEGDRGTIRRAGFGVLIGLPLAAIFAMLLSADAGFATVVAALDSRLATVASFALGASILAIAIAFGHALVAQEAASTEVSAELRRPRSVEPPQTASNYRGGSAPEGGSILATSRSGPRLSPLTWGIVLAQVAAVFLVYAIVHRDTDFGGHDVVQWRREITYSSHLHSGFGRLLLSTLLAVGLIVAGHVLLRSPDRTIAGGRSLAIVEIALLGLTSIALWSCGHRLALYEEAYGATRSRVLVGFVVVVAFVALGCAAFASVVRQRGSFVRASFLTGCAVAVLGGWFDADAYVARTNLDRAARGRALDEAYLATLSPDACAAADHPTLRARPELRAWLLEEWRDRIARGDPREWRGIRRCEP